MNISGFNSIGMDAATISKLFAPIPVDGTNTSDTSAVTPSVSSAPSSANVTSTAIAAIQALVKGGTPASSTSSANASTSAQAGQSLPDWYTATGTTTFTPEGATNSIIMPTDEYQWYKDAGMPQTLDDLKAQVYQTYSVSGVTKSLNDAKAAGNQTNVAYFSSLLNAVKTGSISFEPIDQSVVGSPWQDSVIRDGSGQIIGMHGASCPDFQGSFDKVYTDNSRWYQTARSPISATYVISWSKA